MPACNLIKTFLCATLLAACGSHPIGGAHAPMPVHDLQLIDAVVPQKGRCSWPT